MSTMSRGFLASQATAALQVMVLPLVSQRDLMKAHSFLDMLMIAAAGLRAENVNNIINNISKLLPLRPSKDVLQYKFFSGDV